MKRLILVVVLMLFASPALASLQWEDHIRLGNAAYNEQRYDEAQTSYIRAIQKDPQRALAYRNLARAHFWRHQYAAATAFYDHYLRLAPEDENLEGIRSERRLAATRAADEVWVLPDNQRMALAAFQRELEGGRAYTRGGGGAFGLYQTLQRTGYAQPDLLEFRQRLSRRILDEFESLLFPREAELLPGLDLDGWQLQADRLEAIRGLDPQEATAEVVARRARIVGCAMALLTSRFDEAAMIAKTAAEENPDFRFLRWIQIIALIQAGQNPAALQALESFARELGQISTGQLEYARVLRGILLERMQRHEDAADLYLDMLRQ